MKDTVKKIAAEKIRALLEARISRLLGCDVEDLHSIDVRLDGFDRL